jgi:hypothetical protein
VIGHAAQSDLDKPGARVVRHAFLRPLRRRRDQRLLDGILGVSEVMEAANDHAEHLWRKFAQQMLGMGIQ